MAYFSNKRIRLILIVGALCFAMFGGILVVHGSTKEGPPNTQPLQLSKDIDNAVSLAVKSRSTAYAPGETATEGHVILDTKEQDGFITVYTIASYGAFGFENGVFTIVSGSGAIPTIMAFSRDDHGKYSLLEYKEPQDGAGYTVSLKKMFPSNLHDKVLSADKYYLELSKQKEAQATDYLKSIGRTAEVNAAHIPRKLAGIDIQASNKIFAELPKYDSSLNFYPYWLGTKERIEGNIRYIYETSQGKTSDGYDLITFRKTKEDGTVVQEYRYKIVGHEPQRID